MRKNFFQFKNHSKIFIVLLLLVVSLGLIGCSNEEPNVENEATENETANNEATEVEESSESELTGEVVLTSYGGFFDEILETYLKIPFEEAYPGTTVTIAPLVSIAELKQGGGKGVDIVQLNDFDLVEAMNSGLLDEIDSSLIDSWDDLYSQAFIRDESENVYGVTNVFGSYGIAYNSEEIDKPTSWNDFFDPELSGKIALYSQWIPDIIMMGELAGATIDDMNPAWELFKEVTPSVVQYYPSPSSPESLFQSGEIVMAPWYNGRTYAMQANGHPIDFSVPDEGVVLIRSVMGIMEDSENKELAHKLIDFAMSEEVQIAFAEHLYYGPTNSTVQLEGEIVDKVIYGEEAVEQTIVPDWNNILPQREEWLVKWAESTAK